jgi:hypothetical protein
VNLLVQDAMSRVLQSSGSVRQQGPKTDIPTYGDRAFSVAGPMLWNELPTYGADILH